MVSKLFEEIFKDKWGITMGDAGAIGLSIHDFAELLSEKYYESEDIKKKSHIGFGLFTLLDLVDIVENREGIDLDIQRDLKKIKFYNDANAIKLIKTELGVE